MSNLNERLERAKAAALKEMHVDFREATPDEERIIDAFRMFAQELREPEPAPSLDEWNERIEKAQQSVHSDSLAGCEVLTGKGIAAMISRMLYFLKVPEPVAKGLAQSLVRHPDGRVWYCDKDGKNPHFFNHQSHPCDVHCRTMTCEEAFKEGAEIEGKFSDGSVLRAKINTKVDGGCWMSFLNHRSYQLSDADWFLVKPAPEEK